MGDPTDPPSGLAAASARSGTGAPLPRPKIAGMGFNPANFAYHMGTGRWTPGYRVSYAISFFDARTGRESPRSRWWGPRTDPKQLYGGFGLIRIPVDVTGQATSRRIWRQFEGRPVEQVGELPDNQTTKFQDTIL